MSSICVCRAHFHVSETALCSGFAHLSRMLFGKHRLNLRSSRPELRHAAFADAQCLYDLCLRQPLALQICHFLAVRAAVWHSNLVSASDWLRTKRRTVASDSATRIPRQGLHQTISFRRHGCKERTRRNGRKKVSTVSSHDWQIENDPGFLGSADATATTCMQNSSVNTHFNFQCATACIPVQQNGL